ncbi:OmpH family outer membrane protein [Polaribacter sp. Hel1_85]|uniref:OmpH family outer membrane protein n=1 Tax=Polaribacter sp. Hel1_85 TaxID=1250005 RepID=UPI00052D14D7|nr:OmpH family outer membrane protein [Polaribacter sp. Hel1_85]KGL63677.1 outer membrane protein OmpH [Polaribacter sp. Hel1_85]
MKSKIIFICIALLSSISIAQSKVGTVDSEFIINLMPETLIVTKNSQSYGARLDSSFSIKVKEYQTKVEAFKKNEKTLGALAKQADYKELTEMEADIKKYQQNGTKLMQLKSNELMRPLYKKLSDAIAVVAKQEGYAQVLTITGNEFAYIDNKFDITELVLKNLGIKMPEPKK